MSEDIGDKRIKFMQDQLDTLREQTEGERGERVPTGITHLRYDRVLDNAEKVLLDYADELRGDGPYSPIVLMCMDMLGFDTDDLGWAPHAERAERMGW